jgi:hypothetical protein
MSYCPVCKHEFEADVKECPNDKVPLVDELPYQTVESEETVWVEIASAVAEDEARILQGFFEAAGIPSQIESLKFTMEPVNLGALAEIRVFVEASREADAHRLLEERSEEFETLRSEESVVTDDGPATITEDVETTADDEGREP